MKNTKEKGKGGENQAISFLESKGYEILIRNYRYKRSEIDLIGQKDGLLVFVEVKLRKNDRFGEPESFVSDNQMQKIREAAENYIDNSDWSGNVRFDIVAIKERPNMEILHFEDAF